MKKELQDYMWQNCLPKEFKEEVKKIYKTQYMRVERIALLNTLFGHHNLTSDAEGEEMLTCEKSKVQALYKNANEGRYDETISSETRTWCQGQAQLLVSLFGSKCLPDVFPQKISAADDCIAMAKEEMDIEEQKPKVPKTWSELIVNKQSPVLAVELKPVHDGNYQNYHYEESIWNGSPIEKAALAIIKIHQLIDVGYGGNVTDKEWDGSIHYVIHFTKNGFEVTRCWTRNHITFHTKEQAEEFLSYPENVQLLKDYFII